MNEPMPDDVRAEIENELGNDEEEQEDAPQVESIEQLKGIIAALQAEMESMKDKSLRALADAENTRRRAEKDIADAKKYGVANFAKSLLSVADNLRRALEAVPEELKSENDVVKNLSVGVEATERELLRAFEQLGIKQINPMGEIFDPNFHEVMFEMEAAGQEPGTVMQVVEVGYQIHDRILRPARVGVAKNSGQTTGSGVDEMA
ncbi:MAG: nucleotide exchange factor GrpE [Rickettsiales bacterium]|nr:nucleotide exchange factor GrpE [Rickettsiales bacterium]